MLQLEFSTTDAGQISACQLYWELDAHLQFVHAASDVAQATGIDEFRLAAAVREVSRAFVPDWTCSRCGKPRTFDGRTEFNKERSKLLQGTYRQYPFVCKDCQAELREAEVAERDRQEAQARADREAIDTDKRRRIPAMYRLEDIPPVGVETMTLTDSLYLTSVMRGGASENLSKIAPVSLFERPLSPDNDLTVEMLRHLVQRGLLHPHPDSEPAAFVDDLSGFYTLQVHYAPPILRARDEQPQDVLPVLHRLITGPWPGAWYDEALTLWKKVAVAECKEFLLFVLKEHHLELNPGEKTMQNLQRALQRFSSAQVFNVIWRAGRDAAAYYQRGGVSRRQAANAAVAALERLPERAAAEGWDLKPFGRNYQLPQSIVSEVLYNLALQLGDAGFTLVPNMETIRARKSTATG